MVVTVVGIGPLQTGTYQNFNYANRSVYVEYPVKGVDGLVAERFKVPDRISTLEGIRPGDSINVDFNRFGRIDSIRKEG